MKIINVILIASITSLNVSAAFTEPELHQLEEINKEAIKKTENAKNLLDKKIKETISNLPEQKEKIVDLNKTWNITIKKKCNLLIFESLNTYAEIAMKNECLSNEYKSETYFFEQLNH